MRNSLDLERTRATHSDTAEGKCATAGANCALLEKLLAAIGDQARRSGRAGSA
jgi:hypothetical protein